MLEHHPEPRALPSCWVDEEGLALATVVCRQTGQEAAGPPLRRDREKLHFRANSHAQKPHLSTGLLSSTKERNLRAVYLPLSYP